MVGGPWGAAIGGAAGITAGLIRGAGYNQAEQYDRHTIQPALYQAANSGASYSEGSSQLAQMENQAYSALWNLGKGARDYYKQRILPELQQAQAGLDQAQRGGRGYLRFSAAQFHTGGPITDFGDLATSSSEGFIHARLHEHVMNPIASSQNRPWLDAMNGGQSFPALAMRYASNVMSPASGGGANVTLHVHTMDASSFGDWLRRGASMQIQAALNQNAARYGGKALG
jgi:hypothetical protein